MTKIKTRRVKMTRKNLFMLLGSVCLALMLAVPMVAGCAAPTPTPTPTPKPTPTPSPEPEKFKLRYTVYSSPTGSYNPQITETLNRMTELTNGGIEWEFYFGGSLAGIRDTLDAVSSGAADAGWICPHYTPSKMPLTTIGSALFMTRDPWVQSKAEAELLSWGPIQEEFKKSNLHPMFYQGQVPCIIAAPTPIDSLEDIQGKKVRATGWINKAIKRLGGAPVSIAGPEVYESLQRGIIDASSTHAIAYYCDIHLYEIAKYITDPGFGSFSGIVIAMNLDTWNKLPKSYQEVITEVSEGFPDVNSAAYNEVSKTNVDTLVKAGVTPVILSSAEEKRWYDLCVPFLWDDWVKTMSEMGVPAQECMDRYVKAIEKWAKEASPTVGAFDMLVERT